MSIDEKIVKMSEVYGMTNYEISIELRVTLEQVFDALWENKTEGR